MMVPCIYKFKPNEWPNKSATLIQKAIDDTLEFKGNCSVMLTGGRTASRLYDAWTEIPGLHNSKNVSFYFGDERIVSPNSLESNYNLVMRTLFVKGVPSGCSIFRAETDGLNPEILARLYGDMLPNDIDVLILTAGEDGHIASIFPDHNLTLDQETRKTVFVRSPNLKMHRISITPHIILNARKIFLLATGFEKSKPLKKALYSSLNIRSLPIQLTLSGTWLLDEAAASQI